MSIKVFKQGHAEWAGLLLTALISTVIISLSETPYSQTDSAANTNKNKTAVKFLKNLKPAKNHPTPSTVTAQTLLVPSPGQTTTLPVIHKSGTLTTNETWTAGNVYVIDSTVTIPDGLTLTLDPGVIVKVNPYTDGLWAQSGSTLNANGTSNDPVIFTSSRDDSVGGDTNADGSSFGVPNDYLKGIYTQGGTVAVSNTIFRNAANESAIWIACTATGYTVVTDSTFNTGLSYHYCDTQSRLTLERNSFDVSQGYAVDSYNSVITGIELSGLNSNFFSGTGKSNTIRLSGASIPAGSSWTVDYSSGAQLYIYVVHVQVAGSLLIEPGVIVKVDSSDEGIRILEGGTLTANGTSTSPIIFTSYKDDSVGGDTNGDGSSTSASGDYPAGIYSRGGVVNVSHAIFRGASNASAVRVECYNSGQTTITDSIFNSGVSYYYCELQSRLILQRNNFNVEKGYALSSYNSVVTDIALSGPNSNYFTGSGQNNALKLEDAQVPAGTSWTVDSESGVQLLTNGSPIDVLGTLSIGSGVVVKMYTFTDYNSAGIHVAPGGALNAVGSVANPVTFTSYKDDSIGGDTNGDGESSGEFGDYWISINADSGSSVNINHANVSYVRTAYNLYGQTEMQDVSIAYVATALNVYYGTAYLANISIDDAFIGLNTTNANVVFRGTFNDIAGKAIQACNWNSTDCSVDASYSDWGSAGPTASLVCGQVTTAPWKNGATTVNGDLFASQNCDGTPAPDARLNTAATSYASRMSDKGIDCSNGFQDACNAIQTAQQCLGAATTLAASTSSFPLPTGNAYNQPAQWGNMLADNASTYIQSQEGEIPILSAASFATQLLGAVQTVMNVANAYNTCAP